MFSNESRGGGRGAPLLIAVAATAACLAGCGSGSASGHPDAGSVGSLQTATADGARPATGKPTATAARPSAGGRPTASGRTAETLPLAGRVIVIDPGHNPTNYEHTAEINRKVNVGNGRKECDTTGTETNAGYPEAQYTLDVSRRVRALLTARGAKVILTQDGNRAYGPCVDERARIGNQARADAALSIHADGAPTADYGFHVIAPTSMHVGGADTRAIAAPSYRLATTLRAAFAAATKEPFADYLGGGKGLMVRSDLGGLNMSTVPKVFIECGNMRNAHDAKALTDPAWRQDAALGIADGLTTFVEDASRGKG
ncbi:N-acetylmuramoyl-L-alanine amidase [Streptomyces sp. DvalAA-14]|uniref:N-acetylmuramoyl-L-alanine amidase n=1 Tax=unclassified Streptomyces TaxID=2593676 RepID=UPI00081B6E81|nr:N-acetylmuramoyl-L-alanine amidase [Streptomyces sp. DvalAA-14]SCE40412.1 N-acetylmuramoyl-L-alanine amidase [Streptomyces sp. DvalAA-14]